MNATMNEPAALDPLAMLDAMAAERPAGKRAKESKPELLDTTLDQTIADWIEAKRQETTWKSKRETTEGQLIAAGQRFRLDHCAASGAVESTVKINGRISMTAKNQYGEVSADSMAMLKDAFGASDADRFFKSETKITLRDAAAASTDVLSQLITAVGAENFRKWFDVKRPIKVQDAFHVAYCTNPTVRERAQPLVDQEIIKPYKPSFREG